MGRVIFLLYGSMAIILTISFGLYINTEEKEAPHAAIIPSIQSVKVRLSKGLFNNKDDVYKFDYHVVVIDSCEYILNFHYSALLHKANCKNHQSRGNNESSALDSLRHLIQ